MSAQESAPERPDGWYWVRTREHGWIKGVLTCAKTPPEVDAWHSKSLWHSVRIEPVEIGERIPSNEELRENAELKELVIWMQDHEYGLLSHREAAEGGWTIWWTCIDRKMNRLTHPYGNPRDAIRAAKEGKK